MGLVDLAQGSATEGYPDDSSNDEWAVVTLCVTLIGGNAPQREYLLREAFCGLRYIVRIST